MAIGEAIALGIARGVGEGFQQHFADQRRERMELRRMDKSFDAFKKQKQFSFDMQAIAKQNEVLGKWEEAAKRGVNDLAFEAAVKMAEPYAKEDRPKVIRDAMKNFSGMSKASLLSRAGYNKPDYSLWINNPDLQKAIPLAHIAGTADMPDMEQTFKYDPRTLADTLTKSAEKLTDFDKKVTMGKNLISNRVLSVTGFKASDAVISDLYGDGSQLDIEEKGGKNIDPVFTRFSQLKNKVYFPVGGEIKLRSEMDEEDWKQWQAEQTGQVGPQTTEQPTIPEPLGAEGATYETPETVEYLAKEEGKTEAKRLRTEAKNVEDKHGKTIKSYTSLLDLEKRLTSLSPEAREILFGATTLKGALSLTDVGKKIAAKADVPGAKEARRFLALMENISASLKHEQYGSAQTISELKTFADQLGNPGILQNPDTLMDQIRTRQTLVAGDLDASIGEAGREGYLSQHPDSPLASRWAPKEDTKQTVSDSAEEPKYTMEQVQSQVDQWIAQGVYDESQREAVINHLKTKLNL